MNGQHSLFRSIAKTLTQSHVSTQLDSSCIKAESVAQALDDSDNGAVAIRKTKQSGRFRHSGRASTSPQPSIRCLKNPAVARIQRWSRIPNMLANSHTSRTFIKFRELLVQPVNNHGLAAQTLALDALALTRFGTAFGQARLTNHARVSYFDAMWSMRYELTHTAAYWVHRFAPYRLLWSRLP